MNSFRRPLRRSILLCSLLLLSACSNISSPSFPFIKPDSAREKPATPAVPPPVPTVVTPPVPVDVPVSRPVQPAVLQPEPEVEVDEPTEPVAKAPVVAPIPGTLKASRWDKLPDWASADLQQSQLALIQSCVALRKRSEWQNICTRAESLKNADNQTLRGFYESAFTPYQVVNRDGTDVGMVTGYYEPRVRGSRVKTERFRYPLYATPDDLLTIDLGEMYPELKDKRLRGRLEGKKVVPYFSRADIDSGKAALDGKEMFWIDNAVELFFLQIQGSGRVELPDGSMIKVGYDNQNGHPYVSIGRKLVEMGELKLEEASMQGIKRWAERNPERLDELLEKNPSYVFFRELPSDLTAPLGALGVPLTGEYSIAIDRRTIPLGAPVFLSTSYPNTNRPLNRLMLAQDTGGAIKGGVRADFFWGYGDAAGLQAGKMKQRGQMWVLYPKNETPKVN